MNTIMAVAIAGMATMYLVARMDDCRYIIPGFEWVGKTCTIRGSDSGSSSRTPITAPGNPSDPGDPGNPGSGSSGGPGNSDHGHSQGKGGGKGNSK